jgi:hypothetical protein
VLCGEGLEQEQEYPVREGMGYNVEQGGIGGQKVTGQGARGPGSLERQ